MAKKVAFLTRSTGKHIHGQNFLQGLTGRTVKLQRIETPDWFAFLKPSHADAFSRDSDPIKEAKSHYFATHPWDWIHGNIDDLSNIFKELAEGADLLGKSIYEIQLSWDGPEELKHANYSL